MANAARKAKRKLQPKIPKHLRRKRSNRKLEWFENGTLHNLTFGEFLQAPDDNQAATLADYVVNLRNNYPNTIQFNSHLECLAFYVTPLQSCLNSMGASDKTNNDTLNKPLSWAVLLTAFHLKIILDLRTYEDIHEAIKQKGSINIAGHDLQPEEWDLLEEELKGFASGTNPEEHSELLQKLQEETPNMDRAVDDMNGVILPLKEEKE